MLAVWRGESLGFVPAVFGEQRIHRPGAGAFDQQNQREANRQQVVFKTFTRLCAGPVHKQAVRPMAGDDHAGEKPGHGQSEKAAANAQQNRDCSKELQLDDGKGNEPGKPFGLYKVFHGGGKSVAAKPTQQQLTAVRQQHGTQC